MTRIRARRLAPRAASTASRRGPRGGDGLASRGSRRLRRLAGSAFSPGSGDPGGVRLRDRDRRGRDPRPPDGAAHPGHRRGDEPDRCLRRDPRAPKPQLSLPRAQLEPDRGSARAPSAGGTRQRGLPSPGRRAAERRGLALDPTDHPGPQRAWGSPGDSGRLGGGPPQGGRGGEAVGGRSGTVLGAEATGVGVGRRWTFPPPRPGLSCRWRRSSKTAGPPSVFSASAGCPRRCWPSEPGDACCASSKRRPAVWTPGWRISWRSPWPSRGAGDGVTTPEVTVHLETVATVLRRFGVEAATWGRRGGPGRTGGSAMVNARTRHRAPGVVDPSTAGSASPVGLRPWQPGL